MVQHLEVGESAECAGVWGSSDDQDKISHTQPPKP